MLSIRGPVHSDDGMPLNGNKCHDASGQFTGWNRAVGLLIPFRGRLPARIAVCRLLWRPAIAACEGHGAHARRALQGPVEGRESQFRNGAESPAGPPSEDLAVPSLIGLPLGRAIRPLPSVPLLYHSPEIGCKAMQGLERAEPRKIGVVGYIRSHGRSCHFGLNVHGAQGVPSSNLGAPTIKTSNPANACDQLRDQFQELTGSQRSTREPNPLLHTQFSRSRIPS